MCEQNDWHPLLRTHTAIRRRFYVSLACPVVLAAAKVYSLLPYLVLGNKLQGGEIGHPPLLQGQPMQDGGNGLPRIYTLGTWVNKPHGPTAEGRREIAILMSFPPPLRLGFIVADRKPVAPAFAIGSYATA